MTPKKLFAIAFIFACTCLAWFILGASVVVRTGESDQSIAREVEQLWGGQHVQIAPAAFIDRTREVTEGVAEKDAAGNPAVRFVTRTVTETTSLPLSSSRITVDLMLDQRRKGLLWYDTFGVVYKAIYRVHNPDDLQRSLSVQFTFPSKQAPYEAFTFRVGGQEVPFTGDLSQGLSARFTLPPAGETEILVAYRSRGLGDWVYAFAPSGVAQVKDFTLEMTTDFEQIDFPSGTLSPGRKSCTGQGCVLNWTFASLVTGQRVGMDLPNRINPGPMASRITFFAPVSLLFFMTVMVILGILKQRSLHPMNYFFLAAAFFAFHLLLAYLADHINIHAAFVISAAISVFLVVSYLRLVCGMRVALIQAGLSQLVFLVLFSYSFFFEGFTGLTVTVGAVITLFALMQITARIDWEEVFGRRGVTAGK
ncbi:MAG TPA: inner membrane CreD family protein [Patescibacteria group bacterium]|nr:inner membrane CreD family protein [Patescibacteria group bacterium]